MKMRYSSRNRNTAQDAQAGLYNMCRRLTPDFRLLRKSEKSIIDNREMSAVADKM
jgi:hypothetical protein